MEFDLEQQLRTLGRSLDAQTSPVSVGELQHRSSGRADSLVMEPDVVVGLESAQSPRRWILLTAAAAVLVLGMIGSITIFSRSPDRSSPTVSDIDGPTTSPFVEPASTAPQSSSTTPAVTESTLLEVTITPAQTSGLRPDLYPIIQDPDVADAFGQYSAEATQTPTVSALVGRIDGDRLSDRVRIDLQTASPAVVLAGDPQVVDINGTAVDVYATGETSTVVLPGEPSITVSGQDPVSFLQATGLDVISFELSNPFDTVTINEATLPDGYQTIVEPRAQAVGALSAATATSLANSDGPGITVSLTNPLLSFPLGDVLERTDVGGTPAWAAVTPGGYTIIWPISDTTWAQARVRGGPDETLSLAESVEFAANIDFVSETEWRATYRVAEPSFEPGEAFIGIDKGRSDGIEVGMLVESDGAPIGLIADVTDSTSSVILVSSPGFTVDAAVVGTTLAGTASGCRVRGGNDHVGYVCDRPFNDQERVGAEIVATGNSPTIADGTSFGTISSIVDINGETVGLLDLLREFPIAGNTATVTIPS